jgi:hypothetical protein
VDKIYEKTQGNMKPSIDYNSLVTDSKDIKVDDMTDKEFRRVILKKVQEDNAGYK